MKTLPVVLLLTCRLLAQNTPAPSGSFKSLAFLEGTWEAKAQTERVVAAGTYMFGPELGGHILARHSTKGDCKGPATFDCEHGDLLYV